MCSGPDSPPDSDSEASDHRPRAEAGQRAQAAPRKPSVERDDWMTKAMPKSAPGADKEDAGVAEEETVKKVMVYSFWKAKCMSSASDHHTLPQGYLYGLNRSARQGRCRNHDLNPNRVFCADLHNLCSMKCLPLQLASAQRALSVAGIV